MRKFLLIIGLIFIALGISLSAFVYAAWLKNPEAGEPVSIIVDLGDRAADVQEHLAEKDLVSNLGYRLFRMVSSDANHPIAGVYEFRRGTNYQTIARTIALGPPRDEVQVRILEGMTLHDEADILSGFDIDPESVYALTGQIGNETPFDASLAEDFDFLQDLPPGSSLEGYLFPDTYRVWKDQLPESLIRKQLRAFQEKVIIPFEEDRRKSGMSWHEVITLASIVEAEVRQSETRKIVAGIFLNRMNIGWRLQSDATLNYIIGEGRHRATLEDLELDSLYNSYKHGGLPPGPIGNPSISAIEAVLYPTDTDYLFFLTDDEGNVYYASTNEEHQANRVKAYGN